MFRLYLNYLLRDVRKNKFFFFFNVLGLMAGIACFICVIVLVLYETSYDNYHVNGDRINRVTTTVTSGGNETKAALANGFLPELVRLEFPQVEATVRFKVIEEKLNIKPRAESEAIPLRQAYFTDPTVFSVFTYNVLEGDANQCLVNPNSVVLTRSVARKVFGDRSALDETINVNGRAYLVTAVMDDVPSNSDLSFDALFSINELEPEMVQWAYTFLLFSNEKEAREFQPKLDFLTETKIAPQVNKEGIAIKYNLELLRDVHFSSNQYDTNKGSRVYIRMFLTTGFLILVIAYLNHTHTGAIRSFAHTKEIGIQKIFGAQQSSFVRQFFFDGILLSSAALVLSFGIIWLILPSYASFINRPLSLSDLFSPQALAIVFSCVILLNGVASIYPAYFSKSIQPTEVSRSKTGRGAKIGIFSKAMLGIQFFIAVAMISSAMIIYRQVNYIKSKPLGFNYKDVLVVEIPTGGDAGMAARNMKNSLKMNPNVIMTSFCDANSLPGQFSSIEVVEFHQNSVLTRKSFNNISVDENYFELLEIPIAIGSSFSDARDSVQATGAIASASFVKQAGWEEPIGQKLRVAGSQMDNTVVGVIPDIHFNSLHNPIVPLLVFQSLDRPEYLLIRVRHEQGREAVESVKKLWSTVNPGFPLQYFFLEDRLLGQYEYENNLLITLLGFTLVILTICCFSLVAYGVYIIKHTSLETAIRRILGATFFDIFLRLATQFVFVLLVAFAVATPVTVFVMSKWLDAFIYHVDVSYIDFVVALVLAFGATVAILCYYSYKGILVNPVDTLRQS